jgi:hypothetical protein
MRKKDSTKHSKIYFYGKDADLIVLAISTHKSNIHVIREVDLQTDEMKKMYESYEFVDVHIDNLRNAFYNDLTRTLKNHHFDKIRIINDYIFLTFLVGNDFVISLPYLKIKKDGLEMLISVYRNIKMNQNDYLINYHPDKDDSPQLNIPFFKELISEMSKKEDFLMKKQQNDINKIMSGIISNKTQEKESYLTPFEIFKSRYEHLEVCSPHHPLYKKYHEDFKKVDYNKDYEIWKEEYYKYYLNIDKSNEDDYLNMRIKLPFKSKITKQRVSMLNHESE